MVEEPGDIIPVERTHEFDGHYHVLGGALSPIDGVEPEDLKIDELLTRADDPSSAKSCWPPTRRPPARRPRCFIGDALTQTSSRPVVTRSRAACRSAPTSNSPTKSRSGVRCSGAARLLNTENRRDDQQRRELTADEAAALLRPVDKLGVGLGPASRPPSCGARRARRLHRPAHLRRAAHGATATSTRRPGVSFIDRLPRSARALAARRGRRRFASSRPTSAASRRCWREEHPRVMATPPRRPTPTAGAASRCTPARTVDELHRGRRRSRPPADRRGHREASRARSACRRTTATRCTWTRSTC